MTATIDLCVDGTRRGEAPSATFRGIARDLAAGDWQLTGAVADVAMQAGYVLADVDTVRVVDNRAVLFTGLVAPTSASGVGGLEIINDGTGEQFSLTGPDVWRLLAARLAYPDPTTEAPWALGHDERSGIASTVAADYLSANCGPTAIVARRYTGFTILDGVAGITGSWSARLQPLDQLIARICREGGITCRLGVGFDGAVTAALAAPLDRTSTVILSDQGDLVNIRRRRAPESASFAIAGGQGQLTSRVFVSTGTASGDDRAEVFVDQTTLTTSDEVGQAAVLALAQGAAAWSISAELSTTALQHLVFGVDYRLGDTVAAEIGNVRYPVVVNAVVIELAPQRQVIRPVLGDAAPSPVKGLVADIADLQSRFNTQIA